MDIGFGSPEISLQEVLPVQFLFVSYILWTTPELDWLMTWKALKKEDKNNSTVWSMSTSKLWHLMESLVFTEVSLFHVLVSLFTEDSILVFTIQSSLLYQPQLTCKLLGRMGSYSRSWSCLISNWHNQKKNDDDFRTRIKIQRINRLRKKNLCFRGYQVIFQGCWSQHFKRCCRCRCLGHVR